MYKSTHVPKQLFGYSLQYTECLSVLIDAEIGDFVSVEVLDDVALSSEGDKKNLIQVKAGSGANPISDGSVELWKSIRNWIDQINNKEIDPSLTTFTLYVGAVQRGNLCSMMSVAKSSKEVEEVLQKIEGKFLTPSTKKFRKGVGKALAVQLRVVLKPENREQLALIVSRFDYRHGSGSSYADLRNKFAKMAIQDSLLDMMIDRMAGWTKRRIDSLIETGQKAGIKVKEFRSELNSYHAKLIKQPFLERFVAETTDEKMPENSSKMFFRQLILIEADQEELMEAVSNYLAARTHAILYVKAGTVNETSIPEYAKELEKLWFKLKKKLELQGTAKSDVHFGKSLLVDCSLQQTKMQGSDVPSFFMCGSFHMLADDLKIGWHPNFLQILGGQTPSV